MGVIKRYLLLQSVQGLNISNEFSDKRAKAALARVVSGERCVGRHKALTEE